MEQIYDKPFKTYDEQIAILESRNIIINDHNFAKKVLSGLSYYTIINGYKNTFLSVPSKDIFIKGTTFENLYTLHIIDTSLNSVILKNILFLERYLKTRISYLVSQKYGVYTDKDDLSNTNPNDYLYRGYYGNSSGGRNNILKAIKKSLCSEHINSSVEHYANSKNHVPAWILVSTISFGLTIKWYNILKAGDKTDICLQFINSSTLSIEEKKEFLNKSLNLLREFRNKIAHGNRAFNIHNLPVLPKKALMDLSFQIITEKEYNTGHGKNDIFAVIIICFILIDDRYILTNFLNDLQYILTPYKDISMNEKSIFKILNLPDNIFDRLYNLLCHRFSLELQNNQSNTFE